MSKTYVNAARVLPGKLLDEVKQYCTGLVYVPVGDDFHKERAQLVRRLADLGVSSQEIAQLSGVTRRRVNQILKGKKAGKRGKQVSIDTPEFPW